MFDRTKNVRIHTPVAGTIIPLEQMDDPVFAQKMLGDGAAVKPDDGLVLAPCDGTLVQIFPTRHALGIETPEGIEVLLHLGIDTVELKGEGFEALCKQGERVRAGTPLMRMDLALVADKGYDSVVAVIVTNMDRIRKLKPKKGSVDHQDVLFDLRLK